MPVTSWPIDLTASASLSFHRPVNKTQAHSSTKSLAVARAIPEGAPAIMPTLPFQLARAFATSGCRQYGTLFTVQKALPLFNVFVDSRNRFLGYRS
jgi:hypothetical protein